MSAVPKPREQLRMMIVDDSNVMRRRIERSQQNDRLEVVGTAVNGLDAVTKFKQLMPDVMTLDSTMPEKDGLAALKEIIELDPSARVIMCSALGQESKVLESIKLGAKDFVVKPFQADRVLEAIGKALA